MHNLLIQLKLFIFNNYKPFEITHRVYFLIGVAFIIQTITPIKLNAQIRFNDNYPFSNSLNQATNILALNDGYVLIEQIDDFDSLNTGIGVRKIDFLGNELWVKKIFRKKALLYAGFSNSCQMVNGNELIISSGFIDTLNYEQRAQGSILAINLNGDSLWQRTYGGTWKDGFYSSLLDIDGNLVSVGFYHTSASTYDAWAVKTDTLGNVIWDKKFGGINGDVFSSVVQAPDGGYYLIGGSDSFNSLSDVYLVKVDINGNLLWQKTFSTPLADGANGCLFASNKLYIAGTSFSNFPSSQLTDGLLLISDLDGNQISSKIIGEPTKSNTFRTNPIALTNGDIVVAGENNFHPINSVPWGWLYKFNQDGDSIWARTYSNNRNAPNYIYDLKTTNDGGFIMAGTTIDSLGGIGAQNSWVLKLDEYGCEVENCQLYDAVEKVEKKIVQLSASPNPFNNQTIINYTLQENTKAELLVLEMSTGKVIKRAQVIGDTTQSYLLNNEGLTPGVYAIQLLINSQLINAIKVVYIQ